jgi:uncharacterized membrane protein YjgN (DUF898 family)
VGHSSYESERFSFEGKALDLFLIITFSAIIPMIALGTIFGLMNYSGVEKSVIYPSLGVCTLIIMSAYAFLMTRWKIDFKFKDFRIVCEAEFWNGLGKCLLEFFLSLITAGIYAPMATIRLYQYFVRKTVATSEGHTVGFDYEPEVGKDFWFFWGQILLTIITLGIYVPWALKKVGKRFIDKTCFMDMPLSE